MEESVFWADNIADEIINRKRFRYTDDGFSLPKKPTVKTSSSLSGVLHIGRLTDIIRGEAVYRALKDKDQKAQFIYVAEDMDPLRKIPKGVPANFKDYIGVPVTDVPDPEGCHKNYGEHHLAGFFDIFHEFVQEVPERFSMREEYKKGSFKPYVKEILKNVSIVREVINRFKGEPLPNDWSPWQPVCEKCGKIITPRTTKIHDDGKVDYICKDYDFKTFSAKGCGYEGTSDPAKGNGKLVWKSEWAMQWKHWDVVSEGAGKEYNVPNSAFFVNAEICEKALKYPSPVPIFYEYITIGGGQKMSASEGNVVYPKDWLAVAPAQALRLLFLKRINKARDFTWDGVPRLMDDYDSTAAVYYGREDSEDTHTQRLYEMVELEKPAKRFEDKIPYSTAATIAQIVNLDDRERVASVLRNMGFDVTEDVEKRLRWAETWSNRHSKGIQVMEKLPEAAKKLNKKQKQALHKIAQILEKDIDEKELRKKLFQAADDEEMKPRDLFQAVYLSILGEPRGPRAVPFILSLERPFVVKRFSEV